MTSDKQILKMYSGLRLEELPVEVRERVERRPRLREALEGQARVAALMGLKRYEREDEAVEGRLSHRLLLRIRNGDIPWEQPSLFVLPEWARMLAVVVVMLGLSLMIHREMLQGEGAVPAELAAGGENGISAGVAAPVGAEVPVVLRQVDPFTTVVDLSGSGFVVRSPFEGAEWIQEDGELFPQRPLWQTNRLDRAAGLLPVSQSFP